MTQRVDNLHTLANIGTQDTTNKMTMYAKNYKIIRKHLEDIN
jgi:hypothetical protein